MRLIFFQDQTIIFNLMISGSHINRIKARQIYDSRGNPTVQAQLITELGTFRAAVPSGASTGKYEALQLRDNNPHDHLGKSVEKAVENVNTVLNDALKGKPCEQQAIDKLFSDDSQNPLSKNKIGANSVLSVSLALARATSASLGQPLYRYLRQLSGKKEGKFTMPCPAFNVINGGKHGGNQIAMQQFMVLPTGASSFKEAMKIGAEIYQNLKNILKKKYGISAINVGDEGGFSPNIQDHFEALNLVMQALKVSGHIEKVSIAMDCAASQFYDEEKKQYNLTFKGGESTWVSTELLLKIYEQIVEKYPVVSIEDPFDQDDWQGWKLITKKLGKRIQIVGDDLVVTNPKRIKRAIDQKACNALLLKVNQIGTLSEAIQASKMSIGSDWGVMVSHRSGETEDTFIADLVVGLGVGQIKTGAPCRSERLAKYNQLIRIQEELGQECVYAGKAFKISQ